MNKSEIQYIKPFEKWLKVKVRLQNEKNLPTIQEREIWWCSIGINIGVEEDGKGDVYSRPVLIIKKFSSSSFLGVPLTTQIKERWYYHLIHLHNKQQCVMITQLCLFDTKRLTTKLGKLSVEQFNNVKTAIKNVI
jgi:mRNA interferase MazF